MTKLIVTCLMALSVAVSGQNDQASIAADLATAATISGTAVSGQNDQASIAADLATAATISGTAISEVLATAVSEGNIEAAASAFAVALALYNGCGCSEADAYADVIYRAFTGGDNKMAVSLALAESKASGGCSNISFVLALALALAVNDGDSAVDAFCECAADAGVDDCLPADCITNSFARAVSSAVAQGAAAVATAAADAFAENDAAAVAQGLANARSTGANCSAISEALSAAAAQADLSGNGDAFSQAVSSATSAAECIGQGINTCRSTISRTCCVAEFPDTCACAGRRCRGNKNNDLSIPLLGLRVYDEGLTSTRPCKCA